MNEIITNKAIAYNVLVYEALRINKTELTNKKTNNINKQKPLNKY